jgi:1-acyl-sn-glycerol-3-phosphate acyltransferase
MSFLWKLYLKLIGWNTDVVFPYHHLKKYIFIVGPHTSNWDFVILLAYRNMLRLKAGFLAKKELFKPPFGFIFHNLGGIPVDRKKSTNLVDDVAKIAKERDHFILALSPEGTRSKVEKLKTGFYFIASKAQIPIIMVGLDYRHKTGRFSEPLLPSDINKDFETIYAFYRTMEGKFPENGMMHL